MCSDGHPHMADQKQDDQLEYSYSSYVMIRDVTPKTSRRRWMIGRSGERGSGISVLAARHGDDDILETSERRIKDEISQLCTYQLVKNMGFVDNTEK